jgi:hypothetical protein
MDAVTPFDHRAFYTSGAPVGTDEDTGLRCACGREIISTEDTQTGWAHVGVGDWDDLTGLDEWHAVRAAE